MSHRPIRSPVPAPRALATLLVLAAALVLALGLAGCGGGERGLSAEEREGIEREVTAALAAAFEEGKAETAAPDPEQQRAFAAVHAFYEERGFAPAWTDAGGLTRTGAGLLAALVASPEHGLAPEDYGVADLRAEAYRLGGEEGEENGDGNEEVAVREPEPVPLDELPARLAGLDLRLSFAYATFAMHVARGRIAPEHTGIEWHTERREIEPGEVAAVLAKAAEDGGEAAGEALAGLAPPHEQYGKLQAALAHWRAVDSLPPVPEGETLERGSTGPRVAALERRLAALGFLDRDPGGSEPEPEAGEGAGQGADGAEYDAALEEAVTRFQEASGLAVDGKAGPGTLGAVNVPATERVRRIEANLERWRWVPASFGDRYVLVDVPAFEMFVVEDGEVVERMRVVVGKEYDQTPIFSDTMEYVDINPAWNIPESIAREEVIPKILADPSHLYEQGIEVVSGWGETERVHDPWSVDWDAVAAGEGGLRLKQRPGPDNPLGQIKFMFPNEHDVYLHDSPADHLFGRGRRGLSHGCVRVERPLDLAAHVLAGDPRWDRSRIEAAMASGERAQVSLPRPLPVHILYWTAWVGDDGRVAFREDIYDVDTKLAAALDREPEIGLEIADLTPAGGAAAEAAEGNGTPAGESGAPAARNRGDDDARPNGSRSRS